MAKRYFGGEDATMARKYYGSNAAKSMARARSADLNSDTGMIREDRSAPCLLPRNVIDRDWPRSEVYMKTGAADLFMGVKKQMSEDGADMRKAMANGPHKY
jgi:hypothetical protein